ncbi:hypothetical protein Acr_10g0008520 [Actinidia rufa]|uniref:Transmembrane protein n=1 Tax=Actinidia rufa TaxID=165716 RepID=A0A7J0FC44_9ERIC|nr:hypothetical protein Acr_10g0008520 [Actinidia rufa]
MLTLGLLLLLLIFSPMLFKIVSFNDEALPLTNDVQSASIDPTVAAPATVDPTITAAIAALVVHIDGIHKDLVERIRQVHEGIDLIVKRSAHDIKAVQDTLCTLSQCHSEFITKVNDFIRSIRR